MAFMAGTVVGKLILDAKGWIGGINSAKKPADKFMKGLTAISGAIGALGVGAAMVKTIGIANSFGKEFSNVATLVDPVTVNLGKIKADLLSLDSRLGSSTDLTKGLYQALSASVDPAKAVEFVGISAKFAKAALVDTNTAVDVITTTLNAYGMEASEAGKVSDILFETIKRGKTTGAELSSTIGSVIPLAATMGVKFEELGAMIATMTRQGTNSAEATTQLTATMTQLLSPTDEVKKIMAELGIESLSTEVAQNGLVGTLDKLLSATDKSTEATASMFTNVRALRGVLGTTGAGAQGFTNDLNAMKESAGATDDAFEKQELTFDTLKNTMEKLAIKVGDKLLPIIYKIVDAFSETIEKLLKNDELFNALGETIDTIIGIIKSVVDFYLKFKNIIDKVVIAIGLMVIEFGALNFVMNMNPILRIVTLIGLLVIALMKVEQETKIFSYGFKIAGAFVADIFEYLGKIFKSFLNTAVKTFNPANWFSEKGRKAVLGSFKTLTDDLVFEMANTDKAFAEIEVMKAERNKKLREEELKLEKEKNKNIIEDAKTTADAVSNAKGVGQQAQQIPQAGQASNIMLPNVLPPVVGAGGSSDSIGMLDSIKAKIGEIGNLSTEKIDMIRSKLIEGVQKFLDFAGQMFSLAGAEYEKKLTETSSSITTLSGTVATSQASIATLNTALGENQTAIDEINSSTELTSAEKKKEIEQYQENIESIQAKIEAEELSIASTQAEIATLTAQKTALEKQSQGTKYATSLANGMSGALAKFAETGSIVQSVIEFVTIALSPLLDSLGAVIADSGVLTIMFVALSDIFTIVGEIVGILVVGALEAVAPLFTFVAEILGAIAPLFLVVNVLFEFLSIILEALAPAFDAVVIIFEVLAVVLEILNPILKILTPFIELLGLYLQYTLIPLMAVVYILELLTPAIEWVVDAFTKLVNFFIDPLINAIDSLKKKIEFVVGKIKEFTDFLADKIFGFFKRIGNGFVDFINGIIKLINKLPGVKIDKLQRFEKGGEAPSGTPILVGEAGPELVTLGRTSRIYDHQTTGKMMGTTINIQFGDVHRDVDIDRAIQMIGQKIRSTARAF